MPLLLYKSKVDAEIVLGFHDEVMHVMSFMPRGRYKEDILAGLQPFEFVLPNFITSDIGLVGALHDPLQGFIVVTVKL